MKGDKEIDAALQRNDPGVTLCEMEKLPKDNRPATIRTSCNTPPDFDPCSR
jgi:hypothetical protein